MKKEVIFSVKLLMNYKIPKLTKAQISKAFICLILCLAFFFGSSKFFLPKESISAGLPLCSGYSGTPNPGVNCLISPCSEVASPNPGVNCIPDCANTSSYSGAANPGVNCYYLSKPLCSSTATASSIANPNYRVNCADLIDLPLCIQMKITSEQDGRNCVHECSTNPLQNETIDTATTGHNKTCVRFCDKLPAGLTAIKRNNDNVGNCVPRYCHQLDDNITPNAPPNDPNCSLAKCNLLTPDEMVQQRIQNDSAPNFGQYCDGNVKCYNFSALQLPYVRYRATNTMCKIHDCKPIAVSCGRKETCDGFVLGSATTDDTQNISCNTSSVRMSDGSIQNFADTYDSNGYRTSVGLYSKYINLGLPLTDNSLCNPVVCKPVFYQNYLCSADSNGNNTIRNPSCDSSGDGSVCATQDCPPTGACLKRLGNCYQTVDCNKPENSSNSLCASSPLSDNPQDTDNEDSIKSWFYRPIPPDKAYIQNDPSRGYRLSSSDDCYSVSQMKKQYDGSGGDFGFLGCSNNDDWGCDAYADIPLIGRINVGYFHMQWGPEDRTRSPKACGIPKNGWRSIGYIGLCGNKGNLYNPVSNSTAYHKGLINTTYLDDGDTISKIKVCLRFKNGLRTEDATMSDSETCGSRECAVSCGGAVGCNGQICGDEVCKDLKVQYSNSKECALDNEMFLNARDNRKCAAVVDGFLRLRAVQYGHKVCSFLDVKGTLAYNNMYFNGNEKLDNGQTCVSGSYNSTTGNCDGSKNTNDDSGLADRWRTILRIRYSQGNTTNSKGESGYYLKGRETRDGMQNIDTTKFIKAQECAQVPLPSSPPDLYNLATVNNTSKLFSPPLFIRSVNSVRDGAPASDATSGSLGTTDFLFPEIVVQFGTSTKTLSMGAGYSGYETVKDAKSYAMDSGAISTTLNRIQYKADILIKKDINPDTNQPLLCLYRRVTNAGNAQDIKIGCVNRSFPEINNTLSPFYNTSIPLRKVAISGVTDGANVLRTNGTYADASIKMKYCYDDSCNITESDPNILTITPTDPTNTFCGGLNDNNLERYKICARREKCTMLWKECMENEINIQNLGLDSARKGTRDNCTSIAKECNAKKNLTTTSDSLIDQAISSSTNPKFYGWYNETCIVSGFENKIPDVYQAVVFSPENVQMDGKCKLDASSENEEVCKGAFIKAADWGKKCKCLIYNENLPIDGYSKRPATPRELGLCIDIPTPKVCTALNYGGDSYNTSSLDGTSYKSSGGIVDNNHSNRTISNVRSSNGNNGGNAEYPTAVVGMNNVNGTCNGYWKPAPSNITPKMNCTNDPTSTTEGKWSGILSTANSFPCARFSCSQITTGGNSTDALNDGTYINGQYYSGETTPDTVNETPATAGNIYGITYNDVTLSNRGSSYGFAVWDSYTKTNDFLETTSGIPATSCITGYQATTLPTKKCNQLGNWKQTVGSCTRKMCPAVLPPLNPSTASDWNAWRNSKGATFGVKVYLADGNGNYAGQPMLTNGTAETHLTPASRSTSFVTTGSTRKGYCNKRLGFFQSGPNQPEADCLSDGTWSAVRNPCVSSCTAITNPGNNDGMATWDNVNIEAGNSVVVEGTCKNGYVPYPYSRLRDDAGQLITPTPSVTLAPESKPRRTCGPVLIFDGSYQNTWSGTSSTCVNKCPGYDVDPREGVGKTTYPTYRYGQVEVRWSSINGGETDIKTIAYTTSGTQVGSSGAIDTLTATDYSTVGRTNGSFIVTRYCNPTTFRWSDPVVQCANNGGTINNSVFGTAGVQNFTAANATITTTCSPAFTSSSAPQYKCQAPSNNNIDQYYYEKVSGTDCSRITCSISSGDPSLSVGNSYYQQFSLPTCNQYDCNNSLNSCGSGCSGLFGKSCSSCSSSCTRYDCLNNLNGCTPASCGFTTLTGNINETINLTCDGNFEYSGETTGDGTCSQNAGNSPPVMQCQLSADGRTASWVKVNDCKACSGCNTNSPFNVISQNYESKANDSFKNTASCIGDTKSGEKDHCYYLRSSSTVNGVTVTEPGCSTNPSKYSLIVSPLPSSMTSGTIAYYCNRVGDSANSTGSFGLRCIDGRIDVRVECVNGSGRCTDNSKADSWSVRNSYPSPDNDDWFTSILF